MNGRYILQGHRAVAEPDLNKWAAAFEQFNRVVKQETIGTVKVSTVFLGLDHQFGNGAPLLFETMTFGTPDEEQMCERCSTWEQAEEQHERVARLVREAQSK